MRDLRKTPTGWQIALADGKMRITKSGREEVNDDVLLGREKSNIRQQNSIIPAR